MGRSTETALSMAVSFLEDQVEAGPLGTFIDIQGAFSSTSGVTILVTLRRHKVSYSIKKWVRHMQAGETITAKKQETSHEGRVI